MDAQYIDNMTNYLNEVFADRVDLVIQKFIETVGSDEPSHWQKEGYDILDFITPAEQLEPNELQKRTLILRRGEENYITGVSIITEFASKEKLEVVTRPLTAIQLQEILKNKQTRRN